MTTMMLSGKKKILENRKYVSGYFVPNIENKLYTLIYHIVYHKGYIDKKYIKILKKILKISIFYL